MIPTVGSCAVRPSWPQPLISSLAGGHLTAFLKHSAVVAPVWQLYSHGGGFLVLLVQLTQSSGNYWGQPRLCQHHLRCWEFSMNRAEKTQVLLEYVLQSKRQMSFKQNKCMFR